MSEIDQIEQTSRVTGFIAYLLFLTIGSLTSVIVARTLTASEYGFYSSKTSLILTFTFLAILGANYKIMRGTSKDQLKTTAIFFLKIDGLLILFIGTVLVIVFKIDLVVPAATLIIVIGQILMAILVRMGKKNTVLFAQLFSASLLLSITCALIFFELFTQNRFILASALSLSAGFLWQLKCQLKGINESNYALNGQRLRILRNSLILQLCFIPPLLIIALLPFLISIKFSETEVSTVAAVMSYGGVFQALVNFLTYSVFVPNIINLRDHQSTIRVIGRELSRQNKSLMFMAAVFLVGIYQFGDDALPLMLGDTFNATPTEVFSVCLLYVLQAFIVSQSAYGLVMWTTRGLVLFQGTCLVALIIAVVFAFVISASIISFLMIIAIGSAISALIGVGVNCYSIKVALDEN